MASWLYEALRRCEADPGVFAERADAAGPHDAAPPAPAPPPVLRAQFGDYAAAAHLELSGARKIEVAARSQRISVSDDAGRAAPRRGQPLREALAAAAAPGVDDTFNVDETH